MNEYLQEMSQVIIYNEGTIDKYIGDAIMAFWNAPNPVDGHAYKSIKASLACQKRLAELQAGWTEVLDEGGFKALKCRIGLNSGKVLVGNFGCDQKMDYTIIGDHVNLGSRLEGLNKMYGTYLIASEHVIALIPDASKLLVYRPLGKIAVKGKTNAVKVYEVMALADDTVASSALRVHAAQYTKAMEAFWSGEFGTAQQLFVKCAQDHQDKTAEMMAETAEKYLMAPPANWDGAQAINQKF
jgi:adenylate cyclase